MCTMYFDFIALEVQLQPLHIRMIIIAYIESTMLGWYKILLAEHRFIVRIGPSIVLFHEGLEGDKERYSTYMN